VSRLFGSVRIAMIPAAMIAAAAAVFIASSLHLALQPQCEGGGKVPCYGRTTSGAEHPGSKAF